MYLLRKIGHVLIVMKFANNNKIMSANPLFLDDTLHLIIHVINQNTNPHDIVVTKLCLKLTCKFLYDRIVLNNHFIGNFFKSLTLSTINNPQIFRWFNHKESYNNVWTSYYSSSKADLATLVWCYENGCPMNQMTCYYAASNGHLNVLKYLHRIGCPCDEWSCHAAAKNGHLDVLKYLHQNGCPWDEWSCHAAARNGHLDVLKYLHQNGCPWDQLTCEYATKNKHLRVLEYLYENDLHHNEFSDQSIV